MTVDERRSSSSDSSAACSVVNNNIVASHATQVQDHESSDEEIEITDKPTNTASSAVRSKFMITDILSGSSRANNNTDLPQNLSLRCSDPRLPVLLPPPPLHLFSQPPQQAVSPGSSSPAPSDISSDTGHDTDHAGDQASPCSNGKNSTCFQSIHTYNSNMP